MQIISAIYSDVLFILIYIVGIEKKKSIIMFKITKSTLCLILFPSLRKVVEHFKI